MALVAVVVVAAARAHDGGMAVWTRCEFVVDVVWWRMAQSSCCIMVLWLVCIAVVVGRFRMASTWRVGSRT